MQLAKNIPDRNGVNTGESNFSNENFENNSILEDDNIDEYCEYPILKYFTLTIMYPFRYIVFNLMRIVRI